ncbi:MAG: hypothetical protein ACO3XO_03475 [Bdellovibrionota bacterium]
MFELARFFLLFLVLVIVCPAQVFASSELTTQTTFSPKLKLTLNEKSRIESIILETKQRLRDFHLFFEPSRPLVLAILFLDEDEYHQHYSAPLWSAALYRADQILIKYRREEKLSNKELMNLISHEFIHSIIAHGAGSSCSHSMDEGIAMIFEKLSSHSMDDLLREIAIHVPKENVSRGQAELSFPNLFQRMNNFDIKRSYEKATNEILTLLSQSLQAEESSIVTLEQCLPNIRHRMGTLTAPEEWRRRLEGVQTQFTPSLLKPTVQERLFTWYRKQAASTDGKQFVVPTPPPSLRKW